MNVDGWCQFLIGNVYQLVLSVSNYDTIPFSSQNQSKMFKKVRRPTTTPSL